MRVIEYVILEIYDSVLSSLDNTEPNQPGDTKNGEYQAKVVRVTRFYDIWLCLSSFESITYVHIFCWIVVV